MLFHLSTVEPHWINIYYEKDIAFPNLISVSDMENNVQAMTRIVMKPSYSKQNGCSGCKKLENKKKISANTSALHVRDEYNFAIRQMLLNDFF